jgi:putative redox protein
MKLDLTWKGRMAFEASTPSGARFVIDTYTDQGGDQSGPTPIEAFVSALAACTAIDVVMILQKMRQPLESYSVEVEWERAPEGEWPRPITRVTLRHVVKGDGLDPAAVEKAVRLSDEKYCSVSATLRSGPQIVTTWDVAG